MRESLGTKAMVGKARSHSYDGHPVLARHVGACKCAQKKMRCFTWPLVLVTAQMLAVDVRHNCLKTARAGVSCEM